MTILFGVPHASVSDGRCSAMRSHLRLCVSPSLPSRLLFSTALTLQKDLNSYQVTGVLAASLDFGQGKGRLNLQTGRAFKTINMACQDKWHVDLDLPGSSKVCPVTRTRGPGTAALRR